MIIRILLALLLVAGCSKVPDLKISKTLQVSAERMTEIRSNPHARPYKRGSDPVARLGGLDGDPWPAGMLLYGLANDPYLHELGFEQDVMLMAINGKKVNDIFVSRWQKLRLRRPAGFHADHYKDLIDYLFIENKWNEFVVTVYLDVPGDSTVVPRYVPKVEHWRVRLK